MIEHVFDHLERVWDDAERAALVALLRDRPGGITAARLARAVTAAGGAVSLWDRLCPPTLFDTGRRGADRLEAAARDLGAWRYAGRDFVTFLDPGYPAQLRGTALTPPILFTQGPLRSGAVAVVGARQAAAPALRAAADVGRALAEAGIVVLTGLAAEIDSVVQLAALEAGGSTIAVLDGGIEVGPADQRALRRRIAQRGLVVSPFLPRAAVGARSFTLLNATVSGYAHTTVVLEGRKSNGARGQARRAIDSQRGVVITNLGGADASWAEPLCQQPGVAIAESVDAVVALLGHASAAPDGELRVAS